MLSAVCLVIGAMRRHDCEMYVEGLDRGCGEGVRCGYTGKEDDPAYENRQFEFDQNT
jgi:hypothetical protein